MTNGSLMKVKSIAESSPWSILQYFWPALSNNISWKPIFCFLFWSGPDWSCSQDQIGLFLKIDLATGNHVSQYHLYHVGRLGLLTREGHPSSSFL